MNAAPQLERWPADELEQVLACPACGAPGGEVFSDGLWDATYQAAPGCWTLRRCQACASLWLSPRPTAAAIGRAYSTYFAEPTPASEQPLEAVRVPRLRRGYLSARRGYQLDGGSRLGAPLYRALPPLALRADLQVRQLDYPGPGARLLDVGCGHGGQVAQLVALGWRVDGIDTDPRSLEFARRRGLDTFQGTLLGVWDQLAPGYDAITLSHVLEHLHDPRETLQAAHELLRPGGRIWIATPSARAPGLRLYGPAWRGLEPPRHLTLFSPGALRSQLEQIGFDQVRFPRCPPRAHWYHARSRLVAQRMGLAGGRARRAVQAAAALAVDALELVAPERGEELVAIARRA